MSGKSFRHRFLMLFRCVETLIFWFSSRRKCEKCIFASTRIKKARFKRIEKSSKIDAKTTFQTCCQKVPKITPKVSQNCPKRVPRGLQKEVKIWFQLKELELLRPKSGPRNNFEKESQKTAKPTPKTAADDGKHAGNFQFRVRGVGQCTLGAF